MSRALDLFGTEAPVPPRRVLRAGALSLTYEGGALRHLRLGEVEILRGIACLIRDPDWGTLVPKITEEEIHETATGFRLSYHAAYAAGGAALHTQVTVTADAQGVEMRARLRARGDFITNRAGFVVLHPIEGVAGHPVTVTHGDGAREDAVFPDLIAPWQPFTDIAALTHQAGPWRVRCQLEGDVFEMEDQRQWSDASYKTYVRPLALPWPYVIADGAEQTQSVRLSWQAAAPVAAAPRASVPDGLRFPETALVLTADAARRALARPQDLALVAPQHLLCSFDPGAGDGAAELGAFAALQAVWPGIAFDLELVVEAAAEPEVAFARYAGLVASAGLNPASLMVCPDVDRQSTPPGSKWPDCPPLGAIYRAARAAFPGVPLGGGTVSFFPELNRKRPPVDMLDYVSHGTCPLVHAADEQSLIETLETLPHITRSARAILGGRTYRLGPSTIAMRQNPYGSRTLPNPEGQRLCMTDDDPRHCAAFGAVWTLGYAAAIASAGVDVWTPAALYGPRGLFDARGAALPLAGVVAALARQARAPVLVAQAGEGRVVLDLGDLSFRGNLTEGTTDLGPYGWRMGPSGDCNARSQPR